MHLIRLTHGPRVSLACCWFHGAEGTQWPLPKYSTACCLPPSRTAMDSLCKQLPTFFLQSHVRYPNSITSVLHTSTSVLCFHHLQPLSISTHTHNSCAALTPANHGQTNNRLITVTYFLRMSCSSCHCWFCFFL